VEYLWHSVSMQIQRIARRTRSYSRFSKSNWKMSVAWIIREDDGTFVKECARLKDAKRALIRIESGNA